MWVIGKLARRWVDNCIWVRGWVALSRLLLLVGRSWLGGGGLVIHLVGGGASERCCDMLSVAVGNKCFLDTVRSPH